MVSHNAFENMRRATVNDIGGIIQLIEPLENAGILVRRSREKLETEVSQFVIQERDGLVLSCAALYLYPEADIAELGCVAVNPKYRGGERGDALLAFMERETKQAGINRIFVLTTQTAHWFQERGFVAADTDQLPLAKRELYNFQRNSKIFIKQL
ncbi:MAG: amino-acid N-acetyltransferase [Pseudomonadota bacterium]